MKASSPDTILQVIIYAILVARTEPPRASTHTLPGLNQEKNHSHRTEPPRASTHALPGLDQECWVIERRPQPHPKGYTPFRPVYC
ncbi:20139_t:CDS:2 [Funneliformis geosporum]|nr:20139_t:CDS:2 [Funneliformis geosporum]